MTEDNKWEDGEIKQDKQLELFIFITYFSIFNRSCSSFCLLAWAVDSGNLNHWLFQLLGFEISFVAFWAVNLGVQNHWWGEKFVHWVILSCNDIIEQVFEGGCFLVFWFLQVCLFSYGYFQGVLCRVNDERPTWKKAQLVSGTTVEK